MAAEGDLQKEVATHKKGYEGFVGLMKWGGIVSLLLALIVVFVIAE
ncbi:aa3-type cytochrome c oxidase subunit IV [Sphingosinicella rhizophila]|uniref:Aa3-type cytochrome c oxidase subunit IV n=1 Tax=Sphingosinicella rhizophila TaxID=3050082 RepID=A0ABU3Q4T0_9SPHN|nr:aa3-type cytochrome c oxidase subunit IV [Sphingosinicella sp. GR2756]MDT9598292.1 aa3-type cytochrome c oxidase subunit IV [Sphingosinicella sp. GR2756]